MRLSIPPDDLQQVTAPPPEHKQMSRIRIKLQNLLRLGRQSVESAPHVRHPGSQPDPRVGRHGDHGIRPSISASTADSAVVPSTKIRRPSDSVISTR